MSDDVKEAMDMLGKGYSDDPAAIIEAPRKRIELRGRELVEVETSAWVKLSTAFKTRLPEIDASALKVWLFVSLSVNAESQEAHPGVRTIAEGTGLDKDTVVNAIKRLEEQYQLLQVTRPGVKKVNLYRPTEFVAIGDASPSVRNFRTDEIENGSESVRNFRTDDPENGESVRVEGESVRNQSVLNKKNKIKDHSSVSAETRKALGMSLFGALAGDTVYQADPEQVALQTIRQTWDKIMRTNSPWDRWSTFDKWLLAEERAGRTVETFCRWFVSDKFRAGMVGTWTPNGNKAGQWSFKAIYPQAFPTEETAAIPAQPEPEETIRTLPPQALRDQALARLAAIRGISQ